MRIHIQPKDSHRDPTEADQPVLHWWTESVRVENGAPPPGLMLNGSSPRPPRGQTSSDDGRAERALSQVRHQIDELSTALGQLGPDQVELVRVSPQAIADNPAVAATLDPAILVASLVAAAETEASLEQQLADLQAEIEAGHLRLVQTEQAHAEERGRLQTLDQVIEALHANLEDLREASRWEVVSAGKQRRQLARPGDALAHLGNALPETPPRTSGGVVEMSDEDEASAQSAESRTTLESWLKTRAGETWDPNPNDTDPEPRAEANETETTSDHT